MKFPLLVVIILLVFVSCKKEPGIGGDCEISGSVMMLELNGSFEETGVQYPAEDTYVYIVYGDHAGFDKRIKTDYNGEFRFSYLYPGDYEIYVYSFDKDENDGQSPVIVNVKLEDRKQHLVLDTLKIYAQP